jgi:hypothetical protein
MTTSGTATFDLSLTDAIEEAFERAGGEARSGFDFRTARRSLNLLLAEWGNRGVNMWTMDDGVIPLLAGVATYALPADTVDVLDHVIRTNAGSSVSQSDLSITRISASTYSSIPSKLNTGRPIQVVVNRIVPPSITVWPLPVDNSYQFVYWRMRRMQDATTGVVTMDIPFRFLPALVAGLAYYIAMKLPEGQSRLQGLSAEYDRAWQNASEEDRDRAAVRLVPRFVRVSGV